MAEMDSTHNFETFYLLRNIPEADNFSEKIDSENYKLNLRTHGFKGKCKDNGKGNQGYVKGNLTNPWFRKFNFQNRFHFL